MKAVFKLYTIDRRGRRRPNNVRNGRASLGADCRRGDESRWDYLVNASHRRLRWSRRDIVVKTGDGKDL